MCAYIRAPVCAYIYAQTYTIYMYRHTCIRTRGRNILRYYVLYWNRTNNSNIIESSRRMYIQSKKKETRRSGASVCTRQMIFFFFSFSTHIQRSFSSCSEQNRKNTARRRRPVDRNRSKVHNSFIPRRRCQSKLV